MSVPEASSAARVGILEPYLASDLPLVITTDLPHADVVAGEEPMRRDESPFTMSRGVLVGGDVAEARERSRFPDPGWAPHPSLRSGLGRRLKHRVGVSLADVGLDKIRRPRRHWWWAAGAIIIGGAAGAVMNLLFRFDSLYELASTGAAFGLLASGSITYSAEARRTKRRTAAWSGYRQWRESRVILDASELVPLIEATEEALEWAVAHDELGHDTSVAREQLLHHVTACVRALGEARRLLALSARDYAVLRGTDPDDTDEEVVALRESARQGSHDIRAARATADAEVQAVQAIATGLRVTAERHRGILSATERNRVRRT